MAKSTEPELFTLMALNFAILECVFASSGEVLADTKIFLYLQVNPEYWQAWHSFELETGSEDTFREVS